MNLRAIANSKIQSINPNIHAVLLVNDGHTIDETGRRIPKYVQDNVTIQAQSLSAQERQEFNTLLQQGQMLNVYITGQLHVLRRLQGKGAEKLVFAAYGETKPTEWLVKSLNESWPDWCKVMVWRQQ